MNYATASNGWCFALADIPVLPLADFQRSLIDAVDGGLRLCALFGVPAERLGSSADRTRLFAVAADDRGGSLRVYSAEAGDSYRSITPECPQAHWFERELFEQWGVRPEGHPWLKPVRFHRAYRGDERVGPAAGVTDYFRLEGEEVHEVAVGPVHAGIIEPGHFRFQCHGENVYHLEISLGYQHRGIEAALVGGPTPRTRQYMETLAGDTTIGHAVAYARTIEALRYIAISPRAGGLRSIALELERCANHTGDLGALAGDIGFLPTMSYCGRIRGDFLNMTALLCGSRFGRGLVVPGGVGFDADAERLAELRRRLAAAEADVRAAVDLLFASPGVVSRFESTGVVFGKTAADIGLVGPAARACGLSRDVRRTHPAPFAPVLHGPHTVWDTGDVFGRAMVRWLELQESMRFIGSIAATLEKGPIIAAAAGTCAAESVAVSLVEGWRGEICHVAMTDRAGRFIRYKVVDPSFHNWFGLAMAMRGQQVSDFPLCNKSFNLSYCGHDL